MAEKTVSVSGGDSRSLRSLLERGARKPAGGHIGLAPVGLPDREVVLRPPGEPRYRLGSRVRLVIEATRAGHLLLLNEGTSGTVYCLCPSWYAPDGAFLQPHAAQPGRVVLPLDSRYGDAFEISEPLGREHFLALITDEPPSFNWRPCEPTTPVHIVTLDDIDMLLTWLDRLGEARWGALATAFDVVR